MGWTKTGTIPATAVTDANVAPQISGGTATGVALAAQMLAARLAARLKATVALTANTAPAVDTITRYDATAAARTPTLPALSGLSEGDQLGVQKTDSSANTVTIACAGANTFDSGGTSLILRYPELRILQVVIIGGTKYWKIVAGNSPQSSVDAQILATGQGVFLRRTDSLTSVPTPSYWAHRMGAGPAPEETMEAGRIAVAGGVDVLDMDLQPLGDGALGVIHDSTVDRTTDGTGNVSGFTAPAWRALNAAAKIPWNGKVIPPALFSEVLAEFGGKIPLNVEPKDVTDAGKLMDYADANGLQNSLIVATSSQTVLTAATARGYTTYFYQGGALSSSLISGAFATAVASGADYLGYDGTGQPTVSDPFVPSLVALGKPVIPFTVNRRYRKTQLLALGVAGFLGNEPVYLKGAVAQRKVDSWRQGVLGHGFALKIDGMTNPTISAGVLNYGGGDFFCVGEVSPIANAAGTYSVTIEAMFANASGGFGIGIAPDDQAYLYSGSAIPNGWMGYLRSNGFMTLYKCTAPSTLAAVGSSSAQATAAITAGQWVTLKIDFTATGITLTRTDSGGFTPITLTDSAFRGGYLYLGGNNSVGAFNFRNLAIAP